MILFLMGSLGLSVGAWGATPAEVRASQILQFNQWKQDETEKSLSPSALQQLGLSPRFLKKGDEWTVALLPRSTREGFPFSNKPFLYQFRVQEVSLFRAWIEVTPLSSELKRHFQEIGAPISVRIQITKYWGGAKKETIQISPRGNEIRKTIRLAPETPLSAGLDRYPIDLPSWSRSNGSKITQFPQLPSGLAQWSQNLQWDSQALEMVEIDHWGRKRHFYWNPSHLWPTVVETPGAVLLLIHQKKAGENP